VATVEACSVTEAAVPEGGEAETTAWAGDEASSSRRALSKTRDPLVIDTALVAVEPPWLAPVTVRPSKVASTPGARVTSLVGAGLSVEARPVIVVLKAPAPSIVTLDATLKPPENCPAPTNTLSPSVAQARAPAMVPKGSELVPAGDVQPVAVPVEVTYQVA
jgi:hypothetical protein